MHGPAGGGSWRGRGISLLVAVTFFGAWEAASRLELVNPVLASAPSRIVAAAAQLWRGPELGADLIYSLEVFGAALGLATVVGAATGLLISWSPTAHRLVHPFVVTVNAVPKIALMPLIVLWLGIGMPAGVFLAALMASFPVIIATSTGMRTLERDHVLLARAFGAPRLLTLRTVVLPGVTPYLVSGLRVAVSYALVGVIIAEFFASSRGVGYRMTLYMSNFEVDAFFVCLLLVAGFALLCTGILRAIEARLQSWHPDAFASPHQR